MDKRVVKFGIVGIFNTVLDFSLLNSLVFILHLPVVGANIISVSVALCISFYLNSKYVFKSTDLENLHLTILKFFLVNLFTQFIVQQLVLFLFAYHITDIGKAIYSALHGFSDLSFSERFYIVNSAKVLAIFFSMTANYILYDKLVFRLKKSKINA